MLVFGLQLVWDMRATARKLRDRVGIGHITFLTVIRRGKGFKGSQSHFEVLMDAFNSKLVQLICNEPRMRVHKVVGFTAQDPSVWASDKLHPTREWDTPVFKRYWRELRASLYNAVGALEDDDLHYGEYSVWIG